MPDFHTIQGFDLAVCSCSFIWACVVSLGLILNYFLSRFKARRGMK